MNKIKINKVSTGLAIDEYVDKFENEPIVDVYQNYLKKQNCQSQVKGFTVDSCNSKENWDEFPVPDIRQAYEENGVVGDSGADNLFCDSSNCLIERSKQLIMAGVSKPVKNETHRIINDMFENSKYYADEANQMKELALKEKTRVVRLLAELDYTNIEFGSNTLHGEYVCAAKNGMTFIFTGKDIKQY